MEGVLGEFGNLKIRDMYRQIDIKYIKPCLLRENKIRDPKIIETYETITNNEMVEYIKRNPSNFHIKSEWNSTQSVSQLFQKQNDIENLDIKEVHFNQSSRDLTDAKIHHMLTETMTRSVKKNKSRQCAVNERFLEKNLYKDKECMRRIKKNGYKKRKHAVQKDRVSGSHKQLQDDHVHAVIATSEYAPPPYEDVLSFVVKNKEDGNLKAYENQAFDFKLDAAHSTLPWKLNDHAESDAAVQYDDSKDYVFFNRKESKNSLVGDIEDRKTSMQLYDIDFLNSLTNRKPSRSHPVVKKSVFNIQDSENSEEISSYNQDLSKLYYEKE